MLTRWDPFNEMVRLHDELARRGSERAGFVPAVDILEREDGFELHAELPGLKPDEVDVDVDKNVLTIRGERKHEDVQEGSGYRRVERTFGAFARSFTLPQTVDAEAIEAKLEHGVLTVRLPKQDAQGARKVKVQA